MNFDALRQLLPSQVDFNWIRKGLETNPKALIIALNSLITQCSRLSSEEIVTIPQILIMETGSHLFQISPTETKIGVNFLHLRPLPTPLESSWDFHSNSRENSPVELANALLDGTLSPEHRRSTLTIPELFRKRNTLTPKETEDLVRDLAYTTEALYDSPPLVSQVLQALELYQPVAGNRLALQEYYDGRIVDALASVAKNSQNLTVLEDSNTQYQNILAEKAVSTGKMASGFVL